MPYDQIIGMGGSSMKQTTNLLIQCEATDVRRIVLMLQMLQIDVTDV